MVRARQPVCALSKKTRATEDCSLVNNRQRVTRHAGRRRHNGRCHCRGRAGRPGRRRRRGAARRSARRCLGATLHDARRPVGRVCVDDPAAPARARQGGRADGLLPRHHRHAHAQRRPRRAGVGIERHFARARHPCARRPVEWPHPVSIHDMGSELRAGVGPTKRC